MVKIGIQKELKMIVYKRRNFKLAIDIIINSIQLNLDLYKPLFLLYNNIQIYSILGYILENNMM